MIVIPSIDIKGGRCVRLLQGDFNKTSVYESTPAKIAQDFSKKGASVLHIVDLDGAKQGKISQINCIKAIRQAFDGIIQVGGGIRETTDIDALFKLGIDRIVIGSRAVSDTEKTLQWLETYGNQRIVLALDFNLVADTPYLAVSGWQQQTEHSLWDVLDQYPNILHILCTDISKDGMQLGPNFRFYQHCVSRYPSIEVQASGGVSTVDDILKLKRLGAYGAIIGKAIYENRLNLVEAIACSK